MKVIVLKRPRKFYFKRPVVVLGVFDGVHRGHQQLIRRAVVAAKRVRGTVVVFTFWPHPEHVLRPHIPLPLLVSLPHRLKLISQLGVDVCFVLPFTKKFSRLHPENFARKYLVDMVAPHRVVIGHDFRFGQDREGGLETFRQISRRYGFSIEALHAVKGNKRIISSTLIRSLISSGELRKASVLLGRAVSVMGTVKRGDGRGKELGFPTANIDHADELLPPQGVYAVRVLLGKRTLRGMANVGLRPSFVLRARQLTLEVHILNFRQNIYGKSVVVQFVKKIRDERTFSSSDAFIAQLFRDRQAALRILS